MNAIRNDTEYVRRCAREFENHAYERRDGVCDALNQEYPDLSDYFGFLFRPNHEERVKYRSPLGFWMNSTNQTMKQNNLDRAFALYLFAEILESEMQK